MFFLMITLYALSNRSLFDLSSCVALCEGRSKGMRHVRQSHYHSISLLKSKGNSSQIFHNPIIISFNLTGNFEWKKLSNMRLLKNSKMKIQVHLCKTAHLGAHRVRQKTDHKILFFTKTKEIFSTAEVKSVVSKEFFFKMEHHTKYENFVCDKTYSLQLYRDSEHFSWDQLDWERYRKHYRSSIHVLFRLCNASLKLFVYFCGACVCF